MNAPATRQPSHRQPLNFLRIPLAGILALAVSLQNSASAQNPAPEDPSVVVLSPL